MKWHKIKAFDLLDLNPIKFINKHLDFTNGEWFEKGEKVILNIPVQDADFRKNMTTGEIDPEAAELFEELNGQEVEIIGIDYTEAGYNAGLAETAKPTRVTIKFENGQEWKEVPTLWLSKKEDKEVKAGEDKINFTPSPRSFETYKINQNGNKAGSILLDSNDDEYFLLVNLISEQFDLEAEKEKLQEVMEDLINSATLEELKQKMQQYNFQNNDEKTYSSLEENKYAVERISDLLDTGFEQEEIVDVICNEYDCEPNEVEQFLRKVTAFSENINAIKLAKAMRYAVEEANEELK